MDFGLYYAKLQGAKRKSAAVGRRRPGQRRRGGSRLRCEGVCSNPNRSTQIGRLPKVGRIPPSGTVSPTRLLPWLATQSSSAITGTALEATVDLEMAWGERGAHDELV